MTTDYEIELDIERDGNVVTAVIRKGAIKFSERVPLQVVDKWDEEKKTWYMAGVAARLHKKMMSASPMSGSSSVNTAELKSSTGAKEESAQVNSHAAVGG